MAKKNIIDIRITANDEGCYIKTNIEGVEYWQVTQAISHMIYDMAKENNLSYKEMLKDIKRNIKRFEREGEN